ncbi:MAG: bifunctional precorrin-2 dehydrogenase/sirohydrochlorin ferrochelatase [Desulfobia sp.]
MSYFPVCLDLKDRDCLVIGGGRVASRKVKQLLACGARMTVISPELNSELTVLVDKGDISWWKRLYKKGDLDGAFLVIAATDDPAVQSTVYEEAEEGGILLNVADAPQWCHFILPATVRRGDLTVSISTSGKSPALAKNLREQLEEQFEEEYDLLLQLLGSLRPYVLVRGEKEEKNRDVFERLIHPDLLSWIKERNWLEVEKHIRGVLGQDISLNDLDLVGLLDYERPSQVR